MIARGSHLAVDLTSHAVRDEFFIWEEVGVVFYLFQEFTKIDFFYVAERGIICLF